MLSCGKQQPYAKTMKPFYFPHTHTQTNTYTQIHIFHKCVCVCYGLWASNKHVCTFAHRAYVANGEESAMREARRGWLGQHCIVGFCVRLASLSCGKKEAGKKHRVDKNDYNVSKVYCFERLSLWVGGVSWILKVSTRSSCASASANFFLHKNVFVL